MKELSIEEKAKRYDEVVDRLRYAFNSNRCTLGFMNEILHYPRESEDERIRQELLAWLQNTEGQVLPMDRYNAALTWLEKQGEHKKFRDSIQVGDEVTRNSDGVIVNLSQLKRVAKPAQQKLPIEKLPEEMKTIGESLGFTTQEECDEYNQMVSDLIMSDNDKIEPKFKVGDWIIDDKNRVGIIVRILDEHYIISFDGREVQISFEWEGKLFRKWSIKDAKDGDVLADDTIEGYSSPFVALYKKIDEECDFESYCFVGFDGKFYEGECGHSTDNIHPATKEQCNLLFQKMKEAGYEWDDEKKELKKIELSDVGHEYYSELLKNDTSDNIADYSYQCVYCMSHDWAIENPTWDNVQSACRLGAKWQKKHDVSEDWSEEDEKMIGRVRGIIEAYAFSQSAVDVNGDLCEKKFIDVDIWLKSLKEKYTWKTSSELDEASYQVGIKRVLDNPESYGLTKYNWKPSDEQMKCLYTEVVGWTKGCPKQIVLESLYNDLKKLKGE